MTATSVLVTQRPGRTGRPGRAPRPRLPWANPTVYFVALIVVGLMLAPIAYIIIGGFRTNAQITTDPSGMPQPWVFSNYLDV
jgi:raffinose/stachyose/melibiose transport system permease protein